VKKKWANGRKWIGWIFAGKWMDGQPTLKHHPSPHPFVVRIFSSPKKIISDFLRFFKEEKTFDLFDYTIKQIYSLPPSLVL
jgi:hypothetical protein